MLQLMDVDVTLGRENKLEKKVLKGLDLNIEQGEFVVVIGDNGAGKSTMFDVISGAVYIDNGKVIIDNQEMTYTSQVGRASLVSRVMQDPRMGTMENMTIEENMNFACMRGKRRGFRLCSNRKRRQLFKEKCAMLNMNLENRLGELVSNLSGGQRQALSLVMALLTDSKILLLDEITAALDPSSAASVMKIAAEIVQQERRTTVMVTHNMTHAIHYGDRTLLLSQGKMIKEFNAADKQTLTPLALAAEFSSII